MEFLAGAEFEVGAQQIKPQSLQILRGYMQHSMAASMFWASCVQPVALLMGYAGEDASYISRAKYPI